MTTSPEDISYETIREMIRSVPPSRAAAERAVIHVDEEGALLVARDARGRIELFLRAPKLYPRFADVRERVVHDTWETTDGRQFSANRILLPAGDHLEAAAALICIELLNNGYVGDPTGAFAKAEPVIDLVLAPVTQANQALTGLAGELSLLDALLSAQDAATTSFIFETWHGWKPSTRDFQLGSVGIEVKATTLGASAHHIQGWYQIEMGAAVGNSVETALYMLSMGIKWLPEDVSAGRSIEDLVAGVGACLNAEERDRLIERVRAYAGAGFQVDASGMPVQKALRRHFMLTFERLYDMRDDRILLPRSADLAQFAHLNPDSVEFDIVLPETVRGDLNPEVGLSASVKRILRQAREA